jgi:hypothetical protein
MSITTRRFFARPCGVSFDATGSASPKPLTLIIDGGTPPAPSAVRGSVGSSSALWFGS